MAGLWMILDDWAMLALIMVLNLNILAQHLTFLGLISISLLYIKLELKLLNVFVCKMHQYGLNSTLFFMYGGREHFLARQD